MKRISLVLAMIAPLVTRYMLGTSEAVPTSKTPKHIRVIFDDSAYEYVKNMEPKSGAKGLTRGIYLEAYWHSDISHKEKLSPNILLLTFARNSKTLSVWTNLGSGHKLKKCNSECILVSPLDNDDWHPIILKVLDAEYDEKNYRYDQYLVQSIPGQFRDASEIIARIWAAENKLHVSLDCEKAGCQNNS